MGFCEDFEKTPARGRWTDPARLPVLGNTATLSDDGKEAYSPTISLLSEAPSVPNDTRWIWIGFKSELVKPKKARLSFTYLVNPVVFYPRDGSVAESYVMLASLVPRTDYWLNVGQCGAGLCVIESKVFGGMASPPFVSLVPNGNMVFDGKWHHVTMEVELDSPTDGGLDTGTRARSPLRDNR